jgi:hypothetical protein
MGTVFHVALISLMIGVVSFIVSIVAGIALNSIRAFFVSGGASGLDLGVFAKSVAAPIGLGGFVITLIVCFWKQSK